MIYNGIFSFCSLYFLFGVVCTLLVACAALWIAAVILERRIKRMREELADDLVEGEEESNA